MLSKYRTELRDVTALLLVGLVARMLLFYDVAVNGDTGLYLYDAKQILWGRQLLVEYPSRSPVMEYLLASAVSLGDSPLVAARSLMAVIGLVVGVAVYLLGKELHSHQAGLWALGLYLLVPFQLVWGLWVKTEPVSALVLVTSFVLAVRYIDAEPIPIWVAGLLGMLFGVAFLIRRVAIVHIGAFSLFVLWYRYREHEVWQSTLRTAALTLASTIGTLAVAYFLLAYGDPGLAWQIAEHHAIALFASDGQGSLGWVGLGEAQPRTAQTNIGALSLICQKCGKNTVLVFQQTIFVTLPVVLILLVALRSWLEQQKTFLSRTALPTALIALSGLAAAQLLVRTSWVSALGVISFGAAVAVVWRTERVDWDEFWQPKYGLLVAVLLALTAGYLYRDRILYTTYFQDFFPYVTVLAGILAVEWRRANQSLLSRRDVVTGLVLLLAVSGGVAGYHAVPYQPDGVDADSHWFTIEKAQAYGEDIEERTAPGERVFSAQPLYVIESDRQLAANLSRKYYAFDGWPDDPKTDQTATALNASLRSGDVALAIVDFEAELVLNDSRVANALAANYCRQDAPLYAETNGSLYRHQNTSKSDCTTYDNHR